MVKHLPLLDFFTVFSFIFTFKILWNKKTLGLLLERGTNVGSNHKSAYVHVKTLAWIKADSQEPLWSVRCDLGRSDPKLPSLWLCFGFIFLRNVFSVSQWLLGIRLGLFVLLRRKKIGCASNHWCICSLLIYTEGWGFCPKAWWWQLGTYWSIIMVI